MEQFRIRLFGKPTIEREQERLTDLPAKALELLCFLLLNAERPHTREFLATLLWQDASEERSKKYFRQVLWQLQTGLAAAEADGTSSLLTVEDNWVRVNIQLVWSDIWQLRRAFFHLKDRHAEELSADEVANLHTTLDHYQSSLLIGWYQDWCLIDRERYLSIYLVLADKFLDSCLTHHLLETGIQYGHTILKHDPVRERTHRRLMRLYAAAGDQTNAVRQFERCREILAREFGMEPTQLTADLGATIRRGELGAARGPEPVAKRQKESQNPLALMLAELGIIRQRLDQLQHDVTSVSVSLQQQLRNQSTPPRSADLSQPKGD